MTIPTPYAGTYYPIYNSGTNQYIVPLPTMPFDKVSALFFAFAHAYPVGTNHAALTLEEGQPLEAAHIAEVMLVAKAVNPQILFLISLGWGKNDWTYINTDYETWEKTGGHNIQNFAFGWSIVKMLRAFKLDGFDIDDESINGSSGYITQENFTAVVGLIRAVLNQAGKEDGKTYYFTITPAFGTALITNDNIVNFDLVNTQNYGDCSYIDFQSYPNANIGKFAYGVLSEGSPGTLPTPAEIAGMAGAFNWSFSADSNSNPPFKVTNGIAQLVHYHSQQIGE
jgi:chitinase